MRISVIGGGHGCYAAAAELFEKGHHVRWWRRDWTAFQGLRDAGALTKALRDAQYATSSLSYATQYPRESPLNVSGGYYYGRIAVTF